MSLFPSGISVALVASFAVLVPALSLSSQIEKVTWLIATNHRDSCSLSLPLVPVSPERLRHHRSVRVSSWTPERSEGQGAHPLHPPRQGQTFPWPAAFGCSSPLLWAKDCPCCFGRSSGSPASPVSSEARCWGKTCPRRGSAREVSLRLHPRGNPGKILFFLASRHVVLTAFISKTWLTSTLLHSTIAWSGENTFCSWVRTESYSIDLVTLSCSCETKGTKCLPAETHLTCAESSTGSLPLCKPGCSSTWGQILYQKSACPASSLTGIFNIPF